MGDIVEPEGVSFKNFNKNPVVAWAHNYTMPPIARALWVRRVDKTIVSKMEFAKTDFAEEIFQLYQEGFLRAFSIGFSPIEKEPVNKDGNEWGPQRYLKSELLEFSAVPVPANPEALTLAVQKGILKTDTIIDLMQKEMDEDGKEKTETSGTGKTVEIKIEKHEDGLTELMAENNQLTEKLKLLEDENVDLKYKIYVLIQAAEKKANKITVDDLVSKSHEIMDGVIRAHTGRV